MEKELTITSKDKGPWGPKETAYRYTMAYLKAEKETIPYIDETSTVEEREFMFEQMLKEICNHIRASHERNMFQTNVFQNQKDVKIVRIIVALLVSVTLLAVVSFLF